MMENVSTEWTKEILRGFMALGVVGGIGLILIIILWLLGVKPEPKSGPMAIFMILFGIRAYIDYSRLKKRR